MYRLFSSFKDHPDREITQDDIQIASGKKALNPRQAKIYFKNLEIASKNICLALEKQVSDAAVRLFFSCCQNLFLFLSMVQEVWDQENFEQLIAEWVVACDQPFEEVDKPEFLDMLAYTHHSSPSLKIPHQDAIKCQIMRMGEDSVELMKEMVTR